MIAIHADCAGDSPHQITNHADSAGHDRPAPLALRQAILEYAREAIVHARSSKEASSPVFHESSLPSPAQLSSLLAAANSHMRPTGKTDVTASVQGSDVLASTLELIALCQVTFGVLIVSQLVCFSMST